MSEFEMSEDDITDIVLQFLDDRKGQMFTAGEISRAIGLPLSETMQHLCFLRALGLLDVMTDPIRGMYFLSSSKGLDRHILYDDHGMRI